MSKTTKMVEAATAWRDKHASEGLDFKGLDAVFTKWNETSRRTGELKSQLKVVKEQGKQQGKELVAVFTAVKGGRKLAIEAKATAEKLIAQKAKEEAKAAAKAAKEADKAAKAAQAPVAPVVKPAKAEKPAKAPSAKAEKTVKAEKPAKAADTVQK